MGFYNFFYFPRSLHVPLLRLRRTVGGNGQKSCDSSIFFGTAPKLFDVFRGSYRKDLIAGMRYSMHKNFEVNDRPNTHIREKIENSKYMQPSLKIVFGVSGFKVCRV